MISIISFIFIISLLLSSSPQLSTNACSESVFAYGSESHVESVLLPQGRQDQDFSVSLHVHVTDELGASTETHLSVQVSLYVILHVTDELGASTETHLSVQVYIYVSLHVPDALGASTETHLRMSQNR